MDLPDITLPAPPSRTPLEEAVHQLAEAESHARRIAALQEKSGRRLREALTGFEAQRDEAALEIACCDEGALSLAALQKRQMFQQALSALTLAQAEAASLAEQWLAAETLAMKARANVERFRQLRLGRAA